MSKIVRFDWAIKYILRHKANFGILEGFLSELLGEDIRIETVLESEGNKEGREDKFNRVDLLVKTGTEEQVIIEVQSTSQWDYLSRMLYGTSKVVTEYLKEGDPYHNIRRVISVNVVFFDLGEGKDYIYRGRTEFQGIHRGDTLKLGEQEKSAYRQRLEEVSEIFPEYYIIKVNQYNEKIKSKFDEWVYFLKTEKTQPKIQAKGLEEAAEKLRVLKLTDEDRQAYERYQDNLHLEASLIDSHYGQGRLKGREEGLAEGELRGRERGLAEGQRAIIQSLVKSGMSDSEIAKMTGLRLSDVQEMLR